LLRIPRIPVTTAAHGSTEPTEANASAGAPTCQWQGNFDTRPSLSSRDDHDGGGVASVRATLRRVSGDELVLLMGAAVFAPGRVPLPWVLEAGGVSEVPSVSGGLIACALDANEVVVEPSVRRVGSA
jgi:hypothetical protein